MVTIRHNYLTKMGSGKIHGATLVSGSSTYRRRRLGMFPNSRSGMCRSLLLLRRLQHKERRYISACDSTLGPQVRGIQFDGQGLDRNQTPFVAGSHVPTQGFLIATISQSDRYLPLFQATYFTFPYMDTSSAIIAAALITRLEH